MCVQDGTLVLVNDVTQVSWSLVGQPFESFHTKFKYKVDVELYVYILIKACE